jgi:hypothetical protein
MGDLPIASPHKLLQGSVAYYDLKPVFNDSSQQYTSAPLQTSAANCRVFRIPFHANPFQ